MDSRNIARALVPVGLIFLGLALLASEYGWIDHINFKFIGPLILIVLGVRALLWPRHSRRSRACADQGGAQSLQR